MPGRILVIEDSKIDREAIRRCLESEPDRFEVVAVPDVESAVAALSEGSFDLLVIDHHLPGSTGLDLLRVARGRGIETPAIYVTGETRRDVVIEAMGLGATHYIAKDASYLKLLGPIVGQSLAIEKLRHEKTRAVKELERAEATYRSLVDSAGELMFQLGHELKVLFANPAFERQLGHPPAGIVGRPEGLAPLLATVDRDATLASWRSMMQTGEAHDLEAQLVSRDGRVHLYSFRHHIRVPAVPGEGHPVIEVVGRDITADRELTRALEAEKQDLERVNTELVRQTRLRSDLLSRVSHEFRSPMSAILGYTDCLLQGLDGPTSTEQVESLERIRRNAHRMMTFITDLLDLSRLESREVVAKLGDFSLAALLERVVRSHTPAVRKAIEISTTCPTDLIVHADEEKIGQAVSHIVENAVRFTTRGSIRVEASLDPHVPDLVQIAVCDSGPGIETEALSVIFEPFRQASEGLARGHEGAGLGLAIADQLVRLHHGHIEVESEVGKGSTFRLRLPIQPQIDPGLPPFVGEEGPAETGVILAVDRDAESLALVAKILEQAGTRVVGVRSIGHAISVVARVKPHAVLVDLYTARADGAALFGRLRDEAASRAVPIVGVSVRGERPVLTDIDTIEWLEKPFRPGDLLDKVHQLVSLAGLKDCLIVDDEDEILNLYEAILKQEGVARIRRATSGQEALEEISKQLPDVVILDLRMPGMDGLEVIRRLRASERTRRLPIMVVTGKALTVEDSRFLSSNVSRVLLKGAVPTLSADLMRYLREAVEFGRTNPR